MQLKPMELWEYLHENSIILPEKAKSNLLIDGKRGGFAYVLFGLDFAVPRNPKGYTRKERNATMLYTITLDNYIDSAEQCAKEHDLDLVLIGRERRILSGFDKCNDSYYKAGIGKAPGTLEDVDRFCEMIKAEYENLDTRSKKISELAEKLRSLH